ncbi:MAG: hypothetical protein ABJA10_01175, partial [Aestuariivirga sp.]
MNVKLATSAISLTISVLLPQSAEARDLSRQCQDYAYRATYINGAGDGVAQGAIGGAVAGAALGAILGHGRRDSVGTGAVGG